MIRVFSANYSKKDYLQMAEMFRAGVKVFCNCGYTACKDCEYNHACTSFLKAAIYCDKKADQMVEP